VTGPGRRWPRAISKCNPLSYEVNALRGLLLGIPANLWLDTGVLAGATVAGIAAAPLLVPRLAQQPQAGVAPTRALG